LEFEFYLEIVSWKLEIENYIFMKLLNKIKNKIKQLEQKKSEKRLPMQVEQEKSNNTEIVKSVLEIFCPYCASANFVKRGTRQKKREKVQLYLCNDCQKTFTPGAVKGKHYPKAIILDAISLYNLGYSLERACGIINKMIEKKKGVDNFPTLCRDKKTAEISDSFGSISFTQSSGLPSENNYSKLKNIVKYKNQNVMEVRGIEPPSSWLASPSSRQATPMTDVLYQKNKFFENKLQPSSLANWVEQYKHLCAYSRMREFGMKLYAPENIIESATLAHRQLYRFRYHKAKTRLIIEEDFKHSKFWSLKEFLDLVTVECPHEYFQQGERASEAPIFFSKTDMIVRSKENYATKLAKFALESVKENKERHDALQRFMLANDSVTVATEVPVYIRREDLGHMQTQLGFELYKSAKAESSKSQFPISKEISNIKSQISNKKSEKLELMKIDELPKLITGHIDILQIRNGMIHILDYKPRAIKERPLEQLTLYALALSRLTGIRVFHFKCAWFDDKDYFEFYPLHLVYKKTKARRKKINTKEGVYNINQDTRRIENLRPTVL